MRKFFNTLFLTLCLSVAASNTFAGSLPVYDEEIAVADAIDPVDPEQERSLLPTCNAYLGQGQLEVTFNKYIGTATVFVVNQFGVVVSSTVVDSEFEFSAHLAAPVGKGVYSLQILGSTGYAGEGTFTIQ